MQDPPLKANSRKEICPQKEDPQTQGKKQKTKKMFKLHFFTYNSAQAQKFYSYLGVQQEEREEDERTKVDDNSEFV